MFAFVLLDLVFSTKPRDWLGRTSPKLPRTCSGAVMCRDSRVDFGAI